MRKKLLFRCVNDHSKAATKQWRAPHLNSTYLLAEEIRIDGLQPEMDDVDDPASRNTQIE